MGNVTGRRPAWKWWICGLLLMASTINYMDRQTLANASVRISHQFTLNEEQYGNLELAFGWAFAVGSALFGLVADRVSVRWLYPLVLLLWSGVGFATGFVESYPQLLVCRTLLGLFEAGHWPCALITTRRLLAAEERTLGNSVLQSGTSLGAILMPIVMALLLTPEPGSWRLPFQLVGAVGVLWVALWLASIPFQPTAEADEATEAATTEPPRRPLAWMLDRRFLVLLIVVISINVCIHVFRVWLPKFLQLGRGYTEQQALYANALFYAATDVGCLAAGAATVWLFRRGVSVHRSRCLVFLACSLLTALSSLLGVLPAGWPLLVTLCLIGMGSLGVFPCFYAFSQDISGRDQGKVIGALGTLAWLAAAPVHTLFGQLIDRTGSYDVGLILAGWAPLLACVPLWWLWPSR
jgi:ACS family hexuronate transporter-like MFS transporter